jgi:uncharacterized membrane protein
MDRIIHNSFFSLDNIYSRYYWLSYASINHYQLLTIAWNIILVLVPLWIFFLLRKYWHKTGFRLSREKFIGIILFIFWLLFFPNSAYIMTDVRHLLNYCPVDSPFKVCSENAWMIIFFFTYSSLGWVSFYYLLKLMADLIKEIKNDFWSDIFIALVIPLTSLGVLLGLLNRFNSLDALFYPWQLFSAFSIYFLNLDYFFNWLVFTCFLYILYLGANLIFRKIK